MHPRTTHLQCECVIIDVIRSSLPKNLTLTLTLIALTLTLSWIHVADVMTEIQRQTDV